MNSNNFVVALTTLKLVFIFCANATYAYSPTYSNEPSAVHDSDGSHDDEGRGYINPQFNLNYAKLQQQQGHHQNQLEQKQQQKYPDQHPDLPYFTTSKTSTTSTSTSSVATPSSFSKSTTSSSDAISATSTKPSLQAAYVYKAAVPYIATAANKDANAVKLTSRNPSASSTASIISAAAGTSYTRNTNINSNSSSEKDDDISKKVIGSSVVTSVSVVLNGDEPEFTDALGQKVPKPQPSLQVASPIDLLNPDRYEFYTFDEHGELVKRLMTIAEIQSIVANGDGEGPTIIHHGLVADRDPEKNVEDIVNSVQSVLNKEVESNKNTSTDNLPAFDTPDVSSSWSMILPAIFGNSGSVDIFPEQKPQQIVMTPETEIMETSTKEEATTTVKNPKPSKRKPGQKRKPITTTTETIPQIIQEELDSQESVYTGMQQYQNLAASMQNFDGFSQLHMQPVYHKLPEIETSTRRVFINNKEVVKAPIKNDKIMFNENLSKKPISVQHKPLPPHRIKKPNVVHTTTKRPQINKQKFKRKPTTTTTTTAASTAIPITSTSTTSAPNTTSPVPVSTSPTPVTTTLVVPQTTKVPKKKKKNPTRHPVHLSTKPSNESTQKPHLTSEKRRPTPKPHRQGPKPSQQHTKYPDITTSSDLVAEGSAHQEVAHNKYQYVSQYRPHPKPNKPTSVTSTSTLKTTSTTIMTTPLPEIPTTFIFSTIPTEPTTKSPIAISLIVKDFPGIQHTKNHYVADHLTTKITTRKPVLTTSSKIPSSSGTSGYPLPSYEVSPEKSDFKLNQNKKESLPSLALTHHTFKPFEQDVHTLQSFDQIMHILKQTESKGDDITSISEKPNLKPIKYGSTENEYQLEEMANKHITTVQNAINTRPSSLLEPLNSHNGDSTLATTWHTEVTTDTSISEETITNVGSSTSAVTMSAQPQYYISSKTPERNHEYIQTKLEKNEGILAISLPSASVFSEVTKDSTIAAGTPTTSNMFTGNLMDHTTEYIKIQNQDEKNFEEFQTPFYDSTAKIPEYFTFEYSEADTSSKPSTEKNYTDHLTLNVRLPVIFPETTNYDEKYADEPILVADLTPQLNMKVIKPSEKINMSDYQTQAATVASTLVDGSTAAADYSMINSNETKDEIEFLMSDVIKQISNSNDILKTQQKNTNNNRYSNQAQLDLTFLMNQTEDKFQYPTSVSVSNDKESNYQHDYKPIFNSNENIQTRNQESKILHRNSTTFYITTQAPEVTATDAAQNNEFNTSIPTHLMATTSNSFSLQKIDNNTDTATTNKNHFSKSSEEIITEKLVSKGETIDDVFTTLSPFQTLTESIEENTKIPVLITQHQKLKIEEEPLFKADVSFDTTTIINILPEETTFFNEVHLTKTEREENSVTEKLSESVIVNDSAYESLENYLQSESTTTKVNMSEDIRETTKTYTETTEEKKPELIETEAATVKIESAESYTYFSQGIEPTESTEHTELDISKNSASKSTDKNEHRFTTENFDSSKIVTEMIISKQTELDETTTGKINDSLETTVTTPAIFSMSEETSAELSAMISEEDETIESIDKDPYIKLGETTTQNPDDSQNDKRPSFEHNVPILAPLKPIFSIINSNISTGIQASLSNGESDEEDEDDQFGYQTLTLSNITSSSSTDATTTTTKTSTTTTRKPDVTTTRRLNSLKPISYFNKQPAYAFYQHPAEALYNKKFSQSSHTHLKENDTHKVVAYTIQTPQQRPMQRPPQLSNLVISSTQATRPPVKLEPSPSNSKGLEATLVNLDEDILAFVKLCNELAFSYWTSITSEKISSARSLIVSPFAITSMLSMVFLGARGSTSGEMNDVLKLDDMITFNPHLVFKNITDSVEKAMDSDIATTAFVREIFSDRANGKVLQFFKEKTQQLYAGHVEEVNFHVVNDIIRRRTNLLVKRHTMGKVLEYLRTNSVWINGPLATISANLFQTDCSHGLTKDRDGEIFFQVHPSVRQRRLVPIPAVLFKSGFTAGYEPNLDATVAAFGSIQDTTSMIYVMPGHLSSISPSDNLDRLEKQLMATAISKNTWSNLLTSLMDRPGLEVQLPRFSHRSFINATLGLQKMGLKGLFKSDYADLRGLTGSSNRDIYLSDMIQINTFSTCGEEKIADHHHVEMYPAPPLRKRNKNVDAQEDDEQDSSEAIIDFGSLVQDSVLGRGFYDDLLDPKYLELPLPLRPRQARVPDAPRLRFDKPFLYFVRHNPTGMILFIGRFNPRLLP